MVVCGAQRHPTGGHGDWGHGTGYRGTAENWGGDWGVRGWPRVRLERRPCLTICFAPLLRSPLATPPSPPLPNPEPPDPCQHCPCPHQPRRHPTHLPVHTAPVSVNPATNTTDDYLLLYFRVCKCAGEGSRVQEPHPHPRLLRGLRQAAMRLHHIPPGATANGVCRPCPHPPSRHHVESNSSNCALIWCPSSAEVVHATYLSTVGGARCGSITFHLVRPTADRVCCPCPHASRDK